MTADEALDVCDLGPDCPYCNAPDPEATAEQTVADLLALVAVYEAKEPAHRFIPTRVLRSFIEGNVA